MAKRITLLCTLQAIFLGQEVAEASRSKLTCYDEYPMTCDEHKVPLEEIDFDLEEACYRIETHILLEKRMVPFPRSHPEYLKGLEAKDDFCPILQNAYSHCSFCQGKRYYEECDVLAVFTRCGEKPTRQQLLENANITQFQTNEDIDRACNELEEIYDRGNITVRPPRSYAMCEKQNLVKHLCPGECTNGCFENPPTCNSDLDTTMEAKDFEEICDMLRILAFDGMEHSKIFNESMRLDYLKVIPKDDPNCTDFRRAYPSCFWCSGEEELCFPRENPPSCDPPGHELEEISQTQLGELCSRIFWERLIHLPQVHFYNVSQHSKYMTMTKNSEKCGDAQNFYHLCSWCAGPELRCSPFDGCEMKNISVPETALSATMAAFNMSGENDTSCYSKAMREYYLHNFFTETTEACYNWRAAETLCHEALCPKQPPIVVQKDYLGTTTQAERNGLIWASRTAAFLSFFGATYILYDILRDLKSRTTVYHQLLIGMAIFDLVTAVAWSFATVPIDRNDAEANHVEGVLGNDATCKAQAFFIQLGFTSIFYNVSLALYYVLVISRGWKEFQLKKIRPYMHVVPVAVGLGLAFGGLSAYHWIEYGCHIDPFILDEKEDEQGDLWPVLVFVVLPLGLSILAITVSMIVVYNSVRKRSVASRKWRFGISQASKIEKAVFWQCLFYVLAFYITWPIMFSVYLFSVDVNAPLGLTMAIAFVAPLQGFSNALVYVRPKLVKEGNAGAENVTNFFSRVFTAIVPGLTDHQSQTMNSCTDNYDPLDGLDPSVAVALDPNDILHSEAPRRDKPNAHASVASADTYKAENLAGERVRPRNHEMLSINCSDAQEGYEMESIWEEQPQETYASNSNLPSQAETAVGRDESLLSSTLPAPPGAEQNTDAELVALQTRAEELRPQLANGSFDSKEEIAEQQLFSDDSRGKHSEKRKQPGSFVSS